MVCLKPILSHFCFVVHYPLIIGDNLFSDLSRESIRLCSQNNISFIFPSRNSTHLTRPFNVAFSKLLKAICKIIPPNWKQEPERSKANATSSLAFLQNSLLKFLRDSSEKYKNHSILQSLFILFNGTEPLCEPLFRLLFGSESIYNG